MNQALLFLPTTGEMWARVLMIGFHLAQILSLVEIWKVTSEWGLSLKLKREKYKPLFI